MTLMVLNTWQQHRISRLVVEKLFGNLNGKRLAVLGLTFTDDTNNTREAATNLICRELHAEGTQPYVHDHKVSDRQMARDL